MEKYHSYYPELDYGTNNPGKEAVIQVVASTLSIFAEYRYRMHRGHDVHGHDRNCTLPVYVLLARFPDSLYLANPNSHYRHHRHRAAHQMQHPSHRDPALDSLVDERTGMMRWKVVDWSVEKHVQTTTAWVKQG